MADRHSLNYDDVRELKLGASFTNNKVSQYHTIKYDFKPASVDVNKMATVDVGTNNQVTVTVPHLDGAGVPQTVFKGNQRPYTKECVLIIDRVTGEITLEKLSSNIQVKKTRQETNQKPRPVTPVTNEFTNTTQRSTSRTRVATNRRTANPNTVPGVAQPNPQARFNGTSNLPKPSNMVRSPPRQQKTSPPQAAPWSGGGNSTLASLPMIGLDDALGGPSAAAPAAPPAPAPAPVPQHNGYARPAYERAAPPAPHAPLASLAPLAPLAPIAPLAPLAAPLPPLDRGHHNSYAPQHHQQVPQQPPQQEDSSSSSSSESGSDSDSASDSDDNDSSAHHSLTNGIAPPNPALPSDVLNDDLCLSESGSDSD